jgi:hypothetical protein
MRALLARSLALVACLGACAAPAEGVDDGVGEGDEAFTKATVAALPEAYAVGKLHSELTEDVRENLRAVLARGRGDANVFVKVGDSITFNTAFLGCLGKEPVADPALEETRAFFTRASWERQSLASTVGWHTLQPITGNPSPLDREVLAMRPSFAIVMLGTNDTYEGSAPSFARNLARVVSQLTSRGVVPILSTIPYRGGAVANAAVPTMNMAVRRVAAEAKVPLVDFHLALEDLPRHGISSDGIHPFVAGASACDFSRDGLHGGFNVRNQVTLEALDRVRRAVLEER